MGITYIAPNSAGNVDLSTYFTHLSAAFGANGGYYFSTSNHLIDSTSFTPDDFSDRIYVGHMISSPDSLSLMFDIEGCVTGTIAGSPIGFQLSGIVSSPSYSVSYLFQEADVIVGNSSNNVFNGYGGNDTIDGSYGDDILFGDDGGDNLIGGFGADFLDGGDGDDHLTGGRGADLLDGGAGYDFVSYVGNTAAVAVTIGRGTAKGGDATGDRLVSIEDLAGSTFADRLTGSAADDTLNGFDGDDRLAGGFGEDVLIGWIGSDRLDGGDGSDTASYAGSTAGVFVDLTAHTASGGHAEGDTLMSIENLTGSDMADVLTGTDTSNEIRGGLGGDTLIGAGGNDLLIGEAGNDVLTGGAGRDIFQFGPAFGSDTILDWQDRSDRIAFVGGKVDDLSDLTIIDTPTGIVYISSADGTIAVRNAQIVNFTAADFLFGASMEPIASSIHDRAFHATWSQAASTDYDLARVCLV